MQHHQHYIITAAVAQARLSALNLFSRHQVRAADKTEQIAVRAVVKAKWQEHQQLYDCSVMFQKVVSIIISIAAVAATALDYVMCKFSLFNPPLMYEPLSHQGVTRTNDPAYAYTHIHIQMIYTYALRCSSFFSARCQGEAGSV
eukprot:9446-Heterococcus_DN1.PRE.3